MDCVCCGRSLAAGILTLPWEDGDNENIQEGYGEDDD